MKLTKAVLALGLAVVARAACAADAAPPPVAAVTTGSTLRVLTYNINGLPAPLKTGTKPLFERIAEILRERRAAGTQPQIVVLQEAFTSDAAVIADTTGYPYVLKGPGRRDTSTAGKVHWAMQTRKAYAAFDDPQKFTGSGLYVLSDYPIVDATYKTFDSDACAGLDCLSNKAILLARVTVPNLDRPLDVITSHFNSSHSAKAPKRTTLLMHERQTDTLKWFLDKVATGNPMILAGDFNTRGKARYSYFRKQLDLTDSGEACVGSGNCAIADGTDVTTVLYNTNDKQFFLGCDHYGLKPVQIARNFDERVDNRPLSDHLGYEVVYQLAPRQ